MEKISKMELAVKMGYVYNSETGDIIGPSGKIGKILLGSK